MKKVAFALFLAVLLAGCGILHPSYDFVVKNACKGAWIVVADGDGRELASRIDPGGVRHVDLDGYQGSTVYLIASGYDLTTNKDLGTAQASRQIPTYSSFTGSNQIQPWDVSNLSHSSSDGGCRQ